MLRIAYEFYFENNDSIYEIRIGMNTGSTLLIIVKVFKMYLVGMRVTTG